MRAGAAYLGDLVGHNDRLGLDDGHDVANDLLGLGAGILGRIALLGLLAVALLGEDNQVSFVGFQTRDVLLERLL